MPDLVLSAVARARRSLNALIVAAGALAWAAPSSLAGGAAALALRAAGIDGGALVWAAALAAGTAIGAARGFSRRMDDYSAAYWLDDRMRDGELLAAALACIFRGMSGRFDADIVERAGAYARRASKVGLPLRNIARKAALAAAACAASVAFISLGSPMAGAAAAATGPAARSEEEAGGGEPAFGEEAGSDPSSFARELFPDDKRLATLAERALREGRTKDFAELLKKAGIELEEDSDRAVGEMARRNLADRGEAPERGGGGASNRSGAGGRRLAAGGRPELADGAEGDGGGGEAGGGEDGDGPSGSGRGEEPGEGLPYPGGGEDGPGSGGRGGRGAGDEEADGVLRGGDGWGTGEGAAREWGRIDPSAGGGDAIIPQSEDAPFLEIVLPGRDPDGSPSAVSPAAGRSSGSAAGRARLPYEYEEYLRSYFLALSEGDRG